MTDLERVACAMAKASADCFSSACGNSWRWENISSISRDYWLYCARAALLAIREPSGRMIMAGDDVDAWGSEDEPVNAPARLVWPAMVDAILNEPQTVVKTAK